MDENIDNNGSEGTSIPTDAAQKVAINLIKKNPMVALGCSACFLILPVMFFVVLIVGGRTSAMEGVASSGSNGCTRKEEVWNKFSDNEKEATTFYKKINDLVSKNPSVNINLVTAILTYGTNPSTSDKYSCNDESTHEDEEGNIIIDKEACIESNNGSSKNSTTLYKDAVKIVDGIKNKTDDEIKLWLKDNYVEQKLKEIKVEIPSKKESKEKLFDSTVNDIYALKEQYESMICDENQPTKSTCSSDIDVKEFLTMTTTDYVNKMGPLAQGDYTKTGVLASVTLAQSILESGWGKSGLTQKAKNFFGIKDGMKWQNSTWDGSVYTANTKEELADGNITDIKSNFRKYKSTQESILDHSAMFMESSIYKKVIPETTYVGQIKAIKDAGYATSSNYVQSLVDVIKTYDLTKWDVKGNSSYSGTCSSGNWPIRSISPTKMDPPFANHGKTNVGQCVWYAQGRAVEILEHLSNNNLVDKELATNNSQKLMSIYGNASEWYENSQKSFNTSKDPKEVKAGSIIVWGGGVHYSGCQAAGCGHVAIVESVTNDSVVVTDGWSSIGDSCPNDWGCVFFRQKTYKMSEYLANIKTGLYDPVLKFKGYIYFLEPKS